jgi:hypothetical protein
MVGRYASKMNFVPTVLFPSSQKGFLYKLGLQGLLIALAEVLRADLDRTVKLTCATASLPSDCAPSLQRIRDTSFARSAYSRRKGPVHNSLPPLRAIN